MENGKSSKIIFFNIILAVFLLPVFCYGYNNETTHPALTKETIDIFNLHYPNLKIGNEFISVILKGSEEEEAPETRCLKHFYDPVYEKGLLGVNLTAKNWAQNTNEQSELSNLAGAGFAMMDLFSSNSDYSWDRAIYEYAWGDKNRAMESLGHILHLIQDMSVPPHVRDDQHLKGVDDSPYEIFTKKFEMSALRNLSNDLADKDIVLKSSLNDYFKSLAILTNNNFFSKDTVLDDKYKTVNTFKEEKKILSNRDEVWFEYSLLDDDFYRIDGYQKNYIIEKSVIEKDYFIDDWDDLILNDYWNILSKQAVLHGAGVMKLFFEEVEKEKQTLTLYNKNQSFAKKIGESIVNLGEETANAIVYAGNKVTEGIIFVGGKVVDVGEKTVKIARSVYSSIYQTITNTNKLSSYNLATVGGSLAENTEAKKATQELQNPENVDNSVDKPVDSPMDNTPNNSMDNTLDNTIDNNNPADNSVDNTMDNTMNNEGVTTEEIENSGVIEPKFTLPSSYAPGFGGGGGVESGTDSSGDTDPTSNTKTTPIVSTTNPTTTIPNPPTIISPVNNQKFSTNSINFTGTASSTNIISTDFSEATTTSNQNGEWELALNNFNQGTTTLSFYASNSEQTVTSSPTIVEIFVDSEAPDILLTIEGCENSISQSNCLLSATSTIINARWSSTAEDLEYFTLNENGTISTTTATTTQIIISGDQNYSFSVIATDKFGNKSQEASQIIATRQLPIVINEIAWSGTDASAYDEWIELYNNTDENISLENWVLFAEDLSPYIPLSGSIPAKSFYLIERKNSSETDELTESSVIDIPADLWVSFGSGINNNGENLVLAFNKNGATTTVDRVSRAGFTNWQGKGVGSSSTHISAERYDPLLPSGDNLENWSTSLNKYILNGIDANGDPIGGTPKERNSINYLITNTATLETDKTLTKINSPYFIIPNGFEIKTGSTLSIEEGVVIKFAPNNSLSLKSFGSIKSNGTENEPVVFTSFYDDEYGGDINKDGMCDLSNASSTSACPNQGDWKQVLIEPSSLDSNFNHTIFRYGGAYRSEPHKYKGMVTVDETNVTFENCIFENSKSKGLQLINTGVQTLIKNNIIRGNNYNSSSITYPFGIYVSGGSPFIQNNLVEENGYGLYLSGSSATVDSNIFNNNLEEAVNSFGFNIFFNNSGAGNKSNGIIIGGDLTETDTTGILKKNNLPYVVDSNVSVVASSTLKINPGVVVKFKDKQFDVYGALEINGGEGERVLFTSLDDDSDGTDVNNDVQPDDISIGQWTGTYLHPMSSSSIKNAEFSYMKYGLLYEDSPINLENVTFKNNQWGVFADTNSVLQTANNIIFENNTSTSTVPLW